MHESTEWSNASARTDHDDWRNVVWLGQTKAFAWRNEPDSAFEWLDRSLAKYRLQVLMTNQNPEFRNLYDDPRWDEFLRRIERHPDQLAEIRFDPQIPD